ncbi:hypothetical protein VTO42DRAFT_5066 [Malbranchea cinnamomea]
MVRLVDALLLCIIPCLIFLHQHLSPYTKVEESFNIQAVHDILKYGIPSGENIPETFRQNYDHFTFPGAVPRTFVGAVILAGLSRPLIWLFSVTKTQSLVRDILGALNAIALMYYAVAVRRAFGRDTALWYILLQASQFHVIYYASRTLPNMFAFGITTIAFANILPRPPYNTQRGSRGRLKLALYLLTISGVIFRAEIAVLLGTTTLYLWSQGNITLRQQIIPAGIAGLFIGLLATTSIDSFFWQQFPLWPELSGFLYNVVAGKASNWGTQPWHFYFTNALPRLLLNPLTYTIAIPLSCLLPARRHAAKSLLIPPLAYISLYSLQPHKEWRFIVYTIPLLTTVAALGASYVWSHRSKSLLYRFLSILFLLSTLASFALSNFFLLPVSMANYPGAHALNTLHEYAHDTKQVITVHMDTLSCQTGITRFLELPPPKSPLFILPGSTDGVYPEIRSGSSKWVYDKTEDEELKKSDAFWDRIDYALVEVANADSLGGSNGKWELVEDVLAFDGVRLLRPGEEEGQGQVEKQFVQGLFGDIAVHIWEKGKCLARKYVTRGWWAEIKLAPKIRIMKHVR